MRISMGIGFVVLTSWLSPAFAATHPKVAKGREVMARVRSLRSAFDVKPYFSDALKEELKLWLKNVLEPIGHDPYPGNLRMGVLMLMAGDRMATRRDRALAAFLATMAAYAEGEHPLVEALHPRLEGLLSEERHAALGRELAALGEKERSILREARKELEGLRLEEVEDPTDRVELAILVLDLRRRLGDLSAHDAIPDLAKALGRGCEVPEALRLEAERTIALVKRCCRKRRRMLARALGHFASSFPKKDGEGRKGRLFTLPLFGAVRSFCEAKWKKGDRLVAAYVSALKGQGHEKARVLDLEKLAERMAGITKELAAARVEGEARLLRGTTTWGAGASVEEGAAGWFR